MSSSQACLVVMYHYVRDVSATAFPAIRALPPDLFERQLDWISEQYRPIEIGELDAALSGSAPLPRNAALLTFDDGLIDHFTVVLPILRRRGLSGVFFAARDSSGPSPRVLPVHKTHFLLARLGAEAFARAVVAECGSDAAASSAEVFGLDRWEHADERAIKDLLNYRLSFVEANRVLDALFVRHLGDETAFARQLYLSEEQLTAMADAGMTIGYHTRSHRMLSRLDLSGQEEELAGGVEWVSGLTGARRVPFCYPWGGIGTYNTDTLVLLERHGYSMAFNTVRRPAVPGRDGAFEIPRVDTRDLPPYPQQVAVPEAAGAEA